MKNLIVILAAVLFATACSTGLVIDTSVSGDGCILWDSARDRAGIAGGPDTQQLITRYNQDKKCQQKKIIANETFTGRGTAQEVLNNATTGGFVVWAQKEQRPLSTHDGNTETHLHGGSADARSDAALTNTNVSTTKTDGSGDDVFCFDNDCHD